VDMEELTLNAS